MFSSKHARSKTSVMLLLLLLLVSSGSFGMLFSERRRWAWWAWAGKSMTRPSSGVRQISPMRWMISWSREELLLVLVLVLGSGFKLELWVMRRVGTKRRRGSSSGGVVGAGVMTSSNSSGGRVLRQSIKKSASESELEIWDNGGKLEGQLET